MAPYLLLRGRPGEFMRGFLSKIRIIDCVVALAILIILAAIVLPIFVPPAGRKALLERARQTAPAPDKR